MKAIEYENGRFFKDGKRYRLRPEPGDTMTRLEYAAANGFENLRQHNRRVRDEERAARRAARNGEG